MKRSLMLMVIPLCMVREGAAMTQQENLVTLGAIDGSNFRAIQVALPEFHRQGLDDLDGYKITVMEKGTSIVIVFRDAEMSLGQRGSGPKLGLAVELSRNGLAIVGSNFSR